MTQGRFEVGMFEAVAGGFQATRLDSLAGEEQFVRHLSEEKAQRRRRDAQESRTTENAG